LKGGRSRAQQGSVWWVRSDFERHRATLLTVIMSVLEGGDGCTSGGRSEKSSESGDLDREEARECCGDGMVVVMSVLMSQQYEMLFSSFGLLLVLWKFCRRGQVVVCLKYASCSRRSCRKRRAMRGGARQGLTSGFAPPMSLPPHSRPCTAPQSSICHSTRYTGARRSARLPSTSCYRPDDTSLRPRGKPG
jgi:hypothetical protein